MVNVKGKYFTRKPTPPPRPDNRGDKSIGISYNQIHEIWQIFRNYLERTMFPLMQ